MLWPAAAHHRAPFAGDPAYCAFGKVRIAYQPSRWRNRFLQNVKLRRPQHELRCDAADTGEFRGSSGASYHVIVEADAEYAFRGEGQRTPSGYRVHGGSMGAAGRVTFKVDGEPWTPPQFGTGRLGPTEIRIESPAGGGWGDPQRRDPELVLLDARNGIISEDAARRIYGVAISPDGRSVDVGATRKLRGG